MINKRFHIWTTCSLFLHVIHAPLTKRGFFGIEWTNSHQCTSWRWGCSSHFGDEQKTHSPCPKLLGFFQSLFCPKIFPSLPHTSPSTSLPPLTSHPPTSPLLPPSSFHTHSITRAQEPLKGEHKQPEQKHCKQVQEGSKRIASKCGSWTRAPQTGGEQEH